MVKEGRTFNFIDLKYTDNAIAKTGKTTNNSSLDTT